MMSAADLSDAVKHIAKPPCEKGCANFAHCQSEHVSCSAFMAYVGGYKSKRESAVLGPSRVIHDLIYRPEAA